jgi:hypothetical protein
VKRSEVFTTAFALKFSALLIAYLTFVSLFLHDDSISALFFRIQDRYLAIGIIAIMFWALAWKPNLSLPRRMPTPMQIGFAAALLAGVLWLGTYAIMFNYPVTRDELMVDFDMGIFRTGKLAEPLPGYWAGYAKALVPNFLLDVPANQLLVSGYGPMNALTRTVFSLLFDPALMNPLLAALGFFLIYRVARRLFPDSSGAVWTVLFGYALSAQIFTNAMTDYPMTGHLTFNLLWLALYLNGRRVALAAAMAVGFVAIGFHQIIFHPLFAAPFILDFALKRQWRPFLAFLAVYAGALLFWMSYPHLVISMNGVSIESGSAAGLSGFIQARVIPLLSNADPGTLHNLFFNVLRFLMWAPMFLGPFLFLALPAVRRGEGIAPHLACGAAVTLAAMIILLPNQGHGWGYRYLHPIMGNILLLSGYGYRRAALNEKEAADRLVVLLGGATVLIAIPFLLWTTRSFIEPYVKLTDLIHRQHSEFVIVDTYWPSAAIDQVRNSAALNNRPLTFSSKDLLDSQVLKLCERGSITLVTRKEFALVDFAPNLPYSPSLDALELQLSGRNCVRPLLLRSQPLHP